MKNEIHRGTYSPLFDTTDVIYTLLITFDHLITFDTVVLMGGEYRHKTNYHNFALYGAKE